MSTFDPLSGKRNGRALTPNARVVADTLSSRSHERTESRQVGFVICRRVSQRRAPATKLPSLTNTIQSHHNQIRTSSLAQRVVEPEMVDATMTHRNERLAGVRVPLQ